MNNIVLILIGIAFIGFIYNNYVLNDKYFDTKQYILQEELEKKINKLNALLEQQKSNPSIIMAPPIRPDIVDIRDANVTENPLYPLYGRTERPIIDMLMSNNMFNLRTRGSDDTYHPVGYAKEVGTGTIYYLMGRQRYSGSSQGDFYLISTDTTNRLKINLLDKSGNQKIKDIYNLPDTITIDSGVFSGRRFEIEQLKNTDLISPYY